jgi:prolyl-tRNA synthetase
MKYSKLFGKTVKQQSKDAVYASHVLLHKAGFVRESTAGRYFYLPLGWRVHEKIRAIIKEEMDSLTAQEMIVPTMHPLSLWQETNRDRSVGYELMLIKDRRKASFALGGTAEEMFVDVVRKFNLSYKDLPFYLYQFTNKFRDELRARGGLLRVREFIMKDAYSFDTDERSFQKTYQLFWRAYQRIFKRLGLETTVVESANGYIGGDYCHEFVSDSPAGESAYLVCQQCGYAIHTDIVQKQCTKCRGTKFINHRGIEVGNIFQLGYYYSKKMKDAVFTAKDGKVKPYYMGCYGIGLGRTMAAIVEKYHDDQGIIWPSSVAPFSVHLVDLTKTDTNKVAKLYQLLINKGIEVLWDDRQDISAGAKFSDADLIGIPWRMVVSLKTKNQVELKKRGQKSPRLVSLKEAMETILCSQQ